MPTTPATRALEQLEQLAAANSRAMQELLIPAGFTAYGPNLQHDTTGVMVAVGWDGYRISWGVPSAPMGLGIVDQPASTAYPVIRDLVMALHNAQLAALAAEKPTDI